MALHALQSQYIDSLLELSDEDLLYEIARAQISNITNKADSRDSKQTPEERFRSRQNRVPVDRLTEFHKQALEPFLGSARETMKTGVKRIHTLLCNSNTLKPYDWAVDAASGNTKDLIAAVAGLLLTNYAAIMAVALPCAVIALKKGLFAFCANGSLQKPVQEQP